jgi:hypothetical protein
MSMCTPFWIRAGAQARSFGHRISTSGHRIWLAPWFAAAALALLLGLPGCVKRNYAPIAAFVSDDPEGTSDITVGFDASSSYDDSAIVFYVWDFGDGSPPRTLQGEEGKLTEHTYLVGSKSVTVSLTVIDDDNVSSEPFSQRVVLANQKPTASFVVASANGLVVTFDASGSSDPDPGESDRLKYTWGFGDANTEDTTNPSIQHRYPGNGRYVVQLVVDDGTDKSTPAFLEIEVEEAQP